MMRLKKLRQASGETQAQIAELLGISRAALANIENGKREPDFKTADILARHFDVSVDYLIGRSDIPTPARDNLLKMAAETDDPEELLALLDIVNKKLQERK